MDSGPLRHARLLEALGFLSIYLNSANDWGWNTVWKLVGAPIPDPDSSPVGASQR